MPIADWRFDRAPLPGFEEVVIEEAMVDVAELADGEKLLNGEVAHTETVHAEVSAEVFNIRLLNANRQSAIGNWK